MFCSSCSTLHSQNTAIHKNDSRIKIVNLGGEFKAFITVVQLVTWNI